MMTILRGLSCDAGAFPFSSVALFLVFWIVFKFEIRMSVRNVRSCASSTMTTLYRDSSGSDNNSRTIMPSVRYFMRVSELETSSKRTEYPTSVPTATFCSAATRAAREVAATLRGCVTAIIPVPAMPDSRRYWGTSTNAALASTGEFKQSLWLTGCLSRTCFSQKHRHIVFTNLLDERLSPWIEKI